MEDFNTPLIEQMKLFATQKHNHPSDCQRYGNMPYTVHLDDVVANAQKFLYYIPEEDKEVIICAA